MRRRSVYLADLSHDPLRTATDGMPLTCGVLASYIGKELGEEVEIRIFRYPNDLSEALKRKAPDALLISNYMWNHELAKYFVRACKAAYPETLVVMGGQNWPIDRDRQEKFLAQMPGTDLYVVGEGEVAATELLRKWIALGGDVARLKEESLPGCARLLPDGTYRNDPPLPRIRDLDLIPSPWQSGLLDPFFEPRLQPVIQTNRGCPFTCTFCNSGSLYLNRVNRHSIDRVKGDLEYIAWKIKRDCPEIFRLHLVDDNFAMYEDDLEICRFLAELQRKYDWPRDIACNTGKNRPDRILQAIEYLGESISFSNAIQSANPETLKLIKRENIKLETYERIQKDLQRRGLPSYGFVLSCLPAETLETYHRGIESIVNAGVEGLIIFQTIMAWGSELETNESRERFGFETMIRLSPSGASRVDGETILEWEEIVVATNTMPRKDAAAARNFDLFLFLFVNHRPFRLLERVLVEYDIKLMELLRHMFEVWETVAPEKVRTMIEGFNAEARGEMFPDLESLRAFYTKDENFEKILTEEIGSALLRKYQAVGYCRHFSDLLRFFCDSAKLLVRSRVPEEAAVAEREIDAVAAYMQGNNVLFGSLDAIVDEVAVELEFDVASWIRADPSVPLRAFLRPGGMIQTFVLSPENRNLLQRALSCFDRSIAGQIKFYSYLPFATYLRTPSGIPAPLLRASGAREPVSDDRERPPQEPRGGGADGGA